ncbi:hypothetical protein G3I60_37675 [Streptomyces sp. SID13666]|uniref:M9 family metallopeptidase N-terminal domain-containing protein n=1 Tax=Streptomyces TaxID=1883 RepID=UPI0013C1905A|nr:MULTISPECIES: M9 family metallopeptidase N-terminal domain-containing protein [Streptomyces]NEA59742.1 hypothetical protein [Streptomyces sp. SID13666]NEA76710.1 hypothetical protein [Streptomyces sp. SID13588]
MRQRFSLPGFLAVVLAASTAFVGLLATPSLAAPAARPVHSSPGLTRPLPPAGQRTGSAADQAAVQGQRLPATPGTTAPAVSQLVGADTGQSQSTELPATISKPPPEALRGAPILSMPSASTPRPASTRPAVTSRAARASIAGAQACTTADFAGRTGAALVSYIKTVDWFTCINPLFSLSGSDANAVFKESQMAAVAGGVASAASAYTGDDSGGISELLYFLQAGYYVRDLHPSDVGTYDSTLTSAVESGLNTLFSSSHSSDVSAGNGSVLSHAFIVTNNAQVPGDYLNVYKRYLNAYTSAWDAYPAMDQALNSIYYPLWRGSWWLIQATRERFSRARWLVRVRSMGWPFHQASRRIRFNATAL